MAISWASSVIAAVTSGSGSWANTIGDRLLGARLEGADLREARLDADALVQARLAGARIDIDTAIAFAAAHGLRVDVGADQER